MWYCSAMEAQPAAMTLPNEQQFQWAPKVRPAGGYSRQPVPTHQQCVCVPIDYHPAQRRPRAYLVMKARFFTLKSRSRNAQKRSSWSIRRDSLMEDAVELRNGVSFSYDYVETVGDFHDFDVWEYVKGTEKYNKFFTPWIKCSDWDNLIRKVESKIKERKFDLSPRDDSKRQIVGERAFGKVFITLYLVINFDHELIFLNAVRQDVQYINQLWHKVDLQRRIVSYLDLQRRRCLPAMNSIAPPIDLIYRQSIHRLIKSK